MTEKQQLKTICDMFDRTFEEEGGKLVKTVAKLKTLISEVYYNPEEPLTEREQNWLAWMYGIIANHTPEQDQEILRKYRMNKDEYTAMNKSLTELYHLTSMYKIMTY